MSEGIRAIVIDSGYANVVTGKRSIEDASEMTQAVNKCFSQPVPVAEPRRTHVMSTSVIGQHLPTPTIFFGIPTVHTYLSLAHGSWLDLTYTICPTETSLKLLFRGFTLRPAPKKPTR